MIRKSMPFSEAMRPAFFRVCIQWFPKCDLSMRRSRQWLGFSIATLMLALGPFAQKEHVSIARISKSNSANEEKSYPKSDNDVGLALWQTKAQRRQAMSFRISTLLTRNLHDVFGENDPARRRAAIDEIFTEDCVFYEPNGVYRGRDELDRIAGAIKATHH